MSKNCRRTHWCILSLFLSLSPNLAAASEANTAEYLEKYPYVYHLVQKSMWDEALKRGVAPETMVLVALSATTNKLSEIFGQEHASLLIKQTADNIASASPDEDTETSGHS